MDIRNGHYVLSTICKTPVKNVTFQARNAYLLTFLLSLTRKLCLIYYLKKIQYLQHCSLAYECILHVGNIIRLELQLVKGLSKIHFVVV